MKLIYFIAYLYILPAMKVPLWKTYPLWVLKFGEAGESCSQIVKT